MEEKLTKKAATRAKVLDKAWLSFGTLFGVFLVLDQFTKNMARKQLSLGDRVDFGFNLSYNDGLVFGIDMPMFLILTLNLGVLLFGAMLVYKEKIWRDKWHLLGLALIASGGIGNLIDRLRFGYVVDFIQVYFWPTFNLADAFIVLGVGLFFFMLIFRDVDFAEL